MYKCMYICIYPIKILKLKNLTRRNFNILFLFIINNIFFIENSTENYVNSILNNYFMN